MISAGAISNIPPFTKPVEFEFDKQVNLFVGPNSIGKSTLLRTLATGKFDLTGSAGPKFVFDSQLRSRSRWIGAPTYRELMNEPDESNKDKWETLAVSAENLLRRIPLIYIPASRVNLPLSEDLTSIREILSGQSNRQSVSEILNNSNSLSLFDSSVVYRATRIINENFQTGNYSENRFDQLMMTSHIPYRCAQRICSDVLDGSSSFDWVQDLPIGPSEERFSVATVHHDMAVRTRTDSLIDPEKGIFVGDLSSGTQGTLLWIWYMALRIADFYEFLEGWEKRPAILILDEMENHLHPSWQRRVIPILLEYFPNLQIFTTSHSPFIVAGLSAGQVHLLKRDEDNAIVATTNKEDITGWTADEILRTFMEVEDPTDEMTAKNATKLRQLRNKEAHFGLDDDEQSELNDLLGKVGGDIVAKGGLTMLSVRDMLT